MSRTSGRARRRTGLREEALLESAVAAPQATMTGKPLFTDPVEIAAAYLFYLCRNHPLVDGNKRTALATCLVFLRENDLLPVERLDTEAWEELTLDVAASALTESRRPNGCESSSLPQMSTPGALVQRPRQKAE